MVHLPGNFLVSNYLSGLSMAGEVQKVTMQVFGIKEN